MIKMEDFNFELADDKNNDKNINILDFTINAYNKKIFIDTDLKIVNTMKYGLIGRNGSGKSTLLKHIAHRIIPIPKKIDLLFLEQEIEPTDISVFDTVMSAHQERLSLLKEYNKILEKMEFSNSDELLVEYEEICDKMTSMEVDKDESLVRKILAGLGFARNAQELPTKIFSGGWRMRISLARALYMEPTLLLLDEPTNHLDLLATLWLTEYLKKWKKTLIVVSHNQNFLNEVCNNIIKIENNKLKYYSGNYDNFVKAYDIELTKWKKEWKKVEREIEKMKKKSVPKKDRQNFLQKCIPPPPKEYIVNINFEKCLELKNPILELENVTFGYDKDKILFKNIYFSLQTYTRMTLVGPNGIGKSTFINLLAGNLEPLDGTIYRNNLLRIGYYNQHFIDFLPMKKTPIEYLQNIGGNVSTQYIHKLLGIVGLENILHKTLIEKLSGGQKSRVAFAALNVMKPHLLLLDEPTNHLDIESINGLINGINEYNGGVIIISHDIELISRTNCELWICENNSISKYKKTYEEYRNEILEDLI